MSLEPRIERVDPELLLALRREVLGDGRSTFNPHMQRDTAADTRHWAAMVGADVVGCVSVMQLRGWALRGMAVSASLRRRGIGARLMDAVVAEVAEPMWCNARLDAVPFYESCGWVVRSPEFTIEGGPHHRMTWAPS